MSGDAGAAPVPDAVKKLIPGKVRGLVVFVAGVLVVMVAVETLKKSTDFDLVDELSPNLRKLFKGGE